MLIEWLVDAEKLVHTVRTPTWLVPPRIQLLSAGKTADIMSQLELTPEGDFTAGQIERFKSDPDFYKKFVKLIEQDVNGNFPIVSEPFLPFFATTITAPTANKYE